MRLKHHYPERLEIHLQTPICITASFFQILVERLEKLVAADETYDQLTMHFYVSRLDRSQSEFLDTPVFRSLQ